MTLGEAAEKGIRRVRRKCWLDRRSYMLIPSEKGRLLRGTLLFDRELQMLAKLPTPQPVFNAEEDTADDYEPYTGRLDPADTEPRLSYR